MPGIIRLLCASGNFVPARFKKLSVISSAITKIDPIYFAAMLNLLSIQNYATVESLEIDFGSGMSVITGETGAGKSIILGALGLTLGDRADKTVIRPGSEKTDLSAEFNTSSNPATEHWLQENDLDAGHEIGLCILRRVVNSDGRSKGYINGSPVTLANLKTLGGMLIDIHSQHEHHSLLLRSTHQLLLDEFGLQQALVASVQNTWKSWQKNFQQIEELSTQSQESSAQFQLIAYQLAELEELALGETELKTLDAEFKKLSHADETLDTLQSALKSCTDDEQNNISRSLVRILCLLKDIPHREKPVDEIITLLDTANIQIEEAVVELRAQLDQFDANPERLDQINRRLTDIHAVARKHKIQPGELAEFTSKLRKQLNRFQCSDEELSALQDKDQALRSEYLEFAQTLSKQRQKAAKKLSSAVNSQLKVLGMVDATLEVKLEKLSSDLPSARGLEASEFLVSTNPGQPAKPLAKVASGGELSRISLAIQVITAQTSNMPALVFDEVDVGIGGGVAKVVGELLRKLGASAQIICVTHQAQVAGQGHQHYFVSKKSTQGNTVTRIDLLDDDQKVRELARMLGGDSYSHESLAHAEQMVVNS